MSDGSTIEWLSWPGYRPATWIGQKVGSCLSWIPPLDWIITGGESGPGARPASPNWFRSIRNQCQTAGVAYFHKQNGEWSADAADSPGDYYYVRVGKRRAGRMLDGRTHDEFPETSR